METNNCIIEVNDDEIELSDEVAHVKTSQKCKSVDDHLKNKYIDSVDDQSDNKVKKGLFQNLKSKFQAIKGGKNHSDDQNNSTKKKSKYQIVAFIIAVLVIIVAIFLIAKKYIFGNGEAPQTTEHKNKYMEYKNKLASLLKKKKKTQHQQQPNQSTEDHTMVNVVEKQKPQKIDKYEEASASGDDDENTRLLQQDEQLHIKTQVDEIHESQQFNPPVGSIEKLPA